jgi:Fe-S cluster biosynthesis and repair protein YggX
MPERTVHCRLLKKDLPGLDRAPFRNELGQKIFDQVSKDGWQMKFMAKQCAIYFGFEEGDAAPTAFVPEDKKE